MIGVEGVGVGFSASDDGVAAVTAPAVEFFLAGFYVTSVRPSQSQTG